MQWGGQVNLEGTPGTHDLDLTCTTLDLKGTAAMAATRTSAWDVPSSWSPDQTIGEVHVFENASLRGQDDRARRVALRTRDHGTIVPQGRRANGPGRRASSRRADHRRSGLLSTSDQNAKLAKADSSELAQFD